MVLLNQFSGLCTLPLVVNANAAVSISALKFVVMLMLLAVPKLEAPHAPAFADPKAVLALKASQLVQVLQVQESIDNILSMFWRLSLKRMLCLLMS
ncbi:hypothetical protein PVK06_034409 [Gossypium arboreum]|uniref:Secreted protein n=1 Tax=Gossypium arboreum TaxID=29729 RepID=A0ABR0NE49_GOSAR|nr:hypothetical protein PVK06_034409 [Gossypium arboreum]